MIRTSRQFLADATQPIEADVCVIGSGPAGITVALEAARRHRRVLLLEGGSDRLTPQSQALYRGRFEGIRDYSLEHSRLRYLGGSSNHWTGFCRPLMAPAFSPNEPLGMPGWPISAQDLAPYMAAAAGILDLAPFPEDQPLDDSFDEIFFAYSDVRFGEKYRQTLDTHERITLVLDANVTRLETDGERISAVHFTPGEPDAPGGSVAARLVVLATGGIENSRLLLWSNRLSPDKPVSRSDALGRYWMEHVNVSAGSMVVAEDAPFVKAVSRRQRPFFSLAPRAVERLQSSGVTLKAKRLSYRGTRALVADLACAAPELGWWAARQLDLRLLCGMEVEVVCEPLAEVGNAVTLDDETDRLGVARAVVRFQPSEVAWRRAAEVVVRYGEYLARSGLGRFNLHPWVVEGAPDEVPGAGYHHMGGTRMAASIEDGVVDANCRVFGQQNLYIAGSSIYPRVGTSNPTFTIVQLALRLGAHLRRV